MKALIFFLGLMATASSLMIFDFTKSSDLSNWVVVVDGVMGGRSSGRFGLNEAGHGVFEGEVSLENNGGFSMVRYRRPALALEGRKKVLLRIKGDGKSYQFRVKAKAGNYYSYIAPFQSSGKWEVVEIPLKDMYPAFRGRRLNIPNFAEGSIEEIAFLIGNKKAEKFKLEIDSIQVK